MCKPANEKRRAARRLRESVRAPVVDEDDFRLLFHHPQHRVDFADQPGQIFRLVIKRDDDGISRIGNLMSGSEIGQKTERQA